MTCATDGIQSAIAKFVSAAYCPKGIQIFIIPELRWYLFCKHMAESVKLPPTIGALKQHILRVHLQASVWGQASIAQQIFLDPLQNGYHRNSDGELTPTTTDILPAPKAVIEMDRCQCKGDCTSQRCSCKSNSLQCTDLCLCSTQWVLLFVSVKLKKKLVKLRLSGKYFNIVSCQTVG